jgi:hypothetical protein
VDGTERKKRRRRLGKKGERDVDIVIERVCNIALFFSSIFQKL